MGKHFLSGIYLNYIIVNGLVPRLWVTTLWKIPAADTQFKQLRKRSPKKILASAGSWNWPAPNSYGFMAQLVEHCTGIAEVTGSNPAEAWIFFFGLLFRNCLNCVSAAGIFHNVVTHNRGTSPFTIMLYYPWWHDGPTEIDLLPTVMASWLSW